MSESSSVEMLQVPEAGCHDKAEMLQYFYEMSQLPNRCWLILGAEADAAQLKAIGQSAEMLAYFKDVMTSTQKWLADFRDQVRVMSTSTDFPRPMYKFFIILIVYDKCLTLIFIMKGSQLENFTVFFCVFISLIGKMH